MVRLRSPQVPQKGFTAMFVIIPIVILVIVVIAGVSIFVSKRNHTSLDGFTKNPMGSAAEKVGSNLAGSDCSGSGPVTLSVSPMKAEDISSIIPYGEMTFEHVTPI